MAFFLPSAAKDIRVAVNKMPDFQATLQSGVLSISGLDQPYESVEVLEVSEATGAQPKFVLLVDTVRTTSLSLAQYTTATSSADVLAISRDSFIILQDGREQVIPFKDIPNFALSKTMLIEKITQYTGMGVIALFTLFLSIIIFIFLFVAKLITIEIVAALVFVVSALAGKGWKFSELTRVGLFAITLPTILATLLSVIGVAIPFLNFLSLLAFMLAVVFTKDGTESVDSTKKIV